MTRGRLSRAAVYDRLESALTELRDRLGGLPSPKEAEYVWADIWHLEAHHSTALEGNTLVLREVEALLEQGRAVGAKPLREYLEVQGYGDAAQWVYAQALEPGEWYDTGELVSIGEVRDIHHRVMQPGWQVPPHPDAALREGPGMFRQHDIAPFGAGMRPPSVSLVSAHMTGWVDSVRTAADFFVSGADGPPLPERLAALHTAFEQIHPFIDGNGRTGRLVLNLILVRLGYPPVIILKQQRPAYLSALESSDRGDHGALGELMARAMHDNLTRFILPSVAGSARLVPLAALVDERFTIAALRQAAQRGRLDAIQGTDGVWRSSRTAVDEYAGSKGKRARSA
jgi:Fic family protein